MKKCFLLFTTLLLALLVRADKKITLSASPAQASIFQIGKDGKEVLLGVGNAVIKVDKDLTGRLQTRFQDLCQCQERRSAQGGSDRIGRSSRQSDRSAL
jgi:hypothetical protein